MVIVPIEGVLAPSQIQFSFITGLDPHNIEVQFKQTVEVYTGWVGVHVRDTGTEVHREPAVSFVPLSKNTVRTYEGPTQIVGSIVTATISSTGDDDGEVNVMAVDSAFVGLVRQPNVDGAPFCLVLTANTGVLHGIVNGISYQVTVISNFRDGEIPMKILNNGVMPVQA